MQITKSAVVCEMNKTKSKFILLLFILAVAATLTVVFPTTAHAANTDYEIDLNDLQPGITETYAGWEYDGNGTIKVLDDVTITGNVSEVSETLYIEIVTDHKKVTWEAEYKAHATFNADLVVVSGWGEFIVADGLISNTYGTALHAPKPSNTFVTVSGGRIESTASDGSAINARVVTLTGGEVSAVEGYAIHAANVSIMSGSLVKVSNGPNAAKPAIYSFGATMVNGGNLEVTGDIEVVNGDGIYAYNDATVNVTGSIIAGEYHTYDTINGTLDVIFVLPPPIVIDIFPADCRGVFASGRDTAVTVTGNIEGSSGGVYAESGSSVTIVGDITAFNDSMFYPYEYPGAGVYAHGEGTTVIVTGNVKGETSGVYAGSGSSVTILGDVTASSEGMLFPYYYPQAGIYAHGEGVTVTVRGDIKANGMAGIRAHEGAEVAATGTVDSSQYGLYAIDTDTTVTVIGAISAGWDGACVAFGAHASITGDITADWRGVWTSGSGTTVTVNGNIEGNSPGVFAEVGPTVTIVGDVTSIVDEGVHAWSEDDFTSVVVIEGKVTALNSTGIGVYAQGVGAAVTVIGDIEAGHSGAYALESGSIEVTGNIKANYGVRGEDQATLSVIGDIESVNRGAVLSNYASATIKGNIEAESFGIEAYNNAVVEVTGNIKAGSSGVQIYDYAIATITGDIETEYWGLNVFRGATLTLTGDITAVMVGIDAQDEGTDVFVKGDITVTGAPPIPYTNVVTGVLSTAGPHVTVDGIITGPNYICFNDIDSSIYSYVSAADFDAISIKPGYLQYTGGDPLSYVWVRDRLSSTGYNADIPVVGSSAAAPGTGDLSILVWPALLAEFALGACSLLLWRWAKRRKL